MVKGRFYSNYENKIGEEKKLIVLQSSWVYIGRLERTDHCSEAVRGIPKLQGIPEPCSRWRVNQKYMHYIICFSQVDIDYIYWMGNVLHFYFGPAEIELVSRALHANLCLLYLLRWRCNAFERPFGVITDGLPRHLTCTFGDEKGLVNPYMRADSAGLPNKHVPSILCTSVWKLKIYLLHTSLVVLDTVAATYIAPGIKWTSSLTPFTISSTELKHLPYEP